VADSLRGHLLQFAGREYLKKLEKGLGLVLNGLAAMLLLTVCTAVFGSYEIASGVRISAVLGLVELAVSLTILWGYWNYTELDPGSASLAKEASSRKVLRIAVAIGAALTLLRSGTGLLVAGLVVTGAPLDMTAIYVISIMLLVFGAASVLAWLVQFFAVLRYTKLIGIRVPDALIVQRSSRYMVLLPLIIVLSLAFVPLLFLNPMNFLLIVPAIVAGPLIVLVLYWNLLNRLRQHLKSILAAGAPAQLPKMAG
jgi:hypothetical protein